MRVRRLAVAAALLAVAGLGVDAQLQPVAADRGMAGLDRALRRLPLVATLMHTAAHPDDEDNSLLVYLNRGRGIRTVLATATRGDGGQNEIGPELFEALGMLRTAELAAMHRYDGTEQYFTRAIDFGFSFSVEETFKRWGKEEILDDFVHLIREIRPDVIVSMRPDGIGGGQHHQASARLTAEAFHAAADPARFPEQIQAGLRPWQPKKLYMRAEPFGQRPPPGSAEPGVVVIDVGEFDPWVGRSYAQLGAEARSMHKCQGFGLMFAPLAAASTRYRLVDTVLPKPTAAEKSLFDGIDTSIAGLAQYVKGEAGPVALVTDGLAAIAARIDAAGRAFASGATARAASEVMGGLASARALRNAIGSANFSAAARYELDARLARKEKDFEGAAELANHVIFDVLADDGFVVPGQTFGVMATVANRGRSEIDVSKIALNAPARWTVRREPGSDDSQAPARLASNATLQVKFAVTVDPQAAPTRQHWEREAPGVDRYRIDKPQHFGLPFTPPPLDATLRYRAFGEEAGITRPVEHRYEESPLVGEKRVEVLVVPALSLITTPEVAIVAPSAATRARDVRVKVLNNTPGRTEALVTLEAPSGWTIAPASQALTFSRENESLTARFAVTPPPAATAGEYRVRAIATTGGERFEEGYQVIEYPHIERRHLYRKAAMAVDLIDARVAPGLKIGYVMGVGDEVPAVIEQLGASVTLLEPDDVAYADLGRFDAIVTGVRAYRVREDLKSNNQRLLKYVEDGGTVVVQYNKFEFNDAQYGPYPAKVSTNRVTDEAAPVTVLEPTHPVFNFPNKVGPAAWAGWVQERGLYFLGERDPRYRDLVSSEDPFEYNKGVKTGMLVEARVGKGRWIYVGLNFWRQLPAGVPGAYQLFANLISLPKAPRQETRQRGEDNVRQLSSLPLGIATHRSHGPILREGHQPGPARTAAAGRRRPGHFQHLRKTAPRCGRRRASRN